MKAMTTSGIIVIMASGPQMSPTVLRKKLLFILYE